MIRVAQKRVTKAGRWICSRWRDATLLAVLGLLVNGYWSSRQIETTSAEFRKNREQLELNSHDQAHATLETSLQNEIQVERVRVDAVPESLKRIESVLSRLEENVDVLLKQVLGPSSSEAK